MASHSIPCFHPLSHDSAIFLPTLCFFHPVLHKARPKQLRKSLKIMPKGYTFAVFLRKRETAGGKEGIVKSWPGRLPVAKAQEK